MAIDPRIPLQVTPPEWNPLAFAEQQDRSRTSHLLQDNQQVTNNIQKTAYADSMITRAADQSRDDPAAWDQNFSQLAQANVPGAAELVGKWSPATVQQVLGRGQMTDRGYLQQQQNAAAAAPRPAAGQPAAPDPFGGKSNAEVAKNLEGVNMMLAPLASGAVRNMKDLNTLVDNIVENGHPEAAKFKGMFADGPLFGEQMRGLYQKLKGSADAAQQRLGANGVDAPEEPKPTYTYNMSEAGPVQQTTPPDGGKSTFEFPTVGGKANPAFLPPPKAAGGAAGMGPEVQAAYDALSPGMKNYIDREAAKYNVTNKLPTLGSGADAAMKKNLIMYAAATQSDQAGRTAMDDLANTGQWKSYLVAAATTARTGANLTGASNALAGSTKLLLDSFGKIGNVPFMPLNDLLNAADETLGSENIIDLKNKLRTTISDYTMLLVRNGVRTDAADREASDLLTSSHTWGQAKTAIKAMEDEARNLKKAGHLTMFDVINNFRRSVGVKPHPVPKELLTPGAEGFQGDDTGSELDWEK